MIESIESFFEPFEIQLEEQVLRLSESTEVVQRARAYLGRCRDIAAKFSDPETFLTAAEDEDMAGQLKDHLAELAIEVFGAAPFHFEEPTVCEMAQSYHDSYRFLPTKNQMPNTCAVYDEIFAIEDEAVDAIEFLTQMAEKSLFVKLATMPVLDKHDLGVHEDELCLPATERHFRAHRKLARKAKSSLEVEIESARLTEIYMIEATYDSLLMHDLFGGLYAALKDFKVRRGKAERAAVVRQFTFISRFFAFDAKSYFEIERLQEFVAKVVVPKERKQRPDVQPAELLKEWQDLLEEALGGTAPDLGPQSRQRVDFWGRSIAILAILNEMLAPKRPDGYQSEAD